MYGAQFTSADRDVSGFKGDYDARQSASRRNSQARRRDPSGSRAPAASTRRRRHSSSRTTSTAAAHRSTRCTAWSWKPACAAPLRAADTRLNWDVSVYSTSLREEILSRDDPNAPGTSLSANIDKTTHAGIEALVRRELSRCVVGDRIEPLISVTFNAFTFDSDPEYGNNRLPSAPRYFAHGEVMYRNAKASASAPRSISSARGTSTSPTLTVWIATLCSGFAPATPPTSGRCSPKLAICWTRGTSPP